MSSLGRLLSFLMVLAVGASTLGAQDEAHLRAALEAKRVTVQIDMPATSSGVDLYPGTSRALNVDQYANRLKDNGTSIKAGESVMITKVKVKSDMIEIHLGGGGYGTFGDAFKTLGNKGADSGSAQQEKIANQRTQALAAGSRFNLHYPGGVTPTDLTLAAMIHALQDYATFSASIVASATEPSPSAASSAPQPAMSSAPAASVHKGMSMQDIERIAGKPVGSKTNGQLITNQYNWQGGTLDADFFNGVLVAYRISSS